MRLDKFLKVSRIIKRRSVARDFADGEKVTINGRVAKPSSEVKKGDIIAVRIGDREHRYEILDIVDNIKAADAASMYRVMD